MNDIQIARRYVQKERHARKDGVDFDLNFTSFKNLMRAKRCYYTGNLLTVQKGEVQCDSDVTIDRVDNSKGYVPGNVVACSRVANQIKGTIESNTNGWNIDIVKSIVGKL